MSILRRRRGWTFLIRLVSFPGTRTSPQSVELSFLAECAGCPSEPRAEPANEGMRIAESDVPRHLLDAERRQDQKAASRVQPLVAQPRREGDAVLFAKRTPEAAGRKACSPRAHVQRLFHAQVRAQPLDSGAEALA